jgi:hypothetical protein
MSGRCTAHGVLAALLLAPVAIDISAQTPNRQPVTAVRAVEEGTLQLGAVGEPTRSGL